MLTKISIDFSIDFQSFFRLIFMSSILLIFHLFSIDFTDLQFD